jgi:hypothetical protein
VTTGPTFRINGVTYAEHIENKTLEGTLVRNGSQDVRTWIAEGANLQNAAKNLLGWAQLSGGAQKYIHRFPPHHLPEWTTQAGKPYLYATRVDWRAVGPRAVPNTSIATRTFEKVFLRTQYSTLPYRVLSDEDMINSGYTTTVGNTTTPPDEAHLVRYVTKQARPSGEFFSIPSGYMKWVDDGRLVEFGIGKLAPQAQLILTWHDVPEDCVPSVYVNPTLNTYSVIEQSVGKVNLTEFNGYGPGRLLLTTVEMKPEISPLGVRQYTISYGVKFVPQGHQKVLKVLANPPAYVEVTTSGATNIVTFPTDGKSIYDWVDFKNLFRPPA